MTPTPIDDDTLLAYLDAQFDDEARYVAVEDALAAQPALRARLQALVDSGEQARRAFDAVLEAPVPPALIAAILNAPLPAALQASTAPAPEPAPTGARRPPPVAPSLGERLSAWLGLNGSLNWGAAAFASVALLAVGGFLGHAWQGPGTAGPVLAEAGQIVREPALALALEAAPSGRRLPTGDGQVELVASFARADGQVCREFAAARPAPVARDEVGVACREADGQWRLAFLRHAPHAATPGGGYQTASTALHEAVDAFIARELPGGALNAEQEQARLLRGW